MRRSSVCQADGISPSPTWVSRVQRFSSSLSFGWSSRRHLATGLSRLTWLSLCALLFRTVVYCLYCFSVFFCRARRVRCPSSQSGDLALALYAGQVAHLREDACTTSCNSSSSLLNHPTLPHSFSFSSLPEQVGFVLVTGNQTGQRQFFHRKKN